MVTRVLLAEDTDSQRIAYTRELRESGFDVLGIVTGDMIESSVSSYKPDILISDTSFGNTRYGDDICRRMLADKKLDGIMVVGISDQPAMEVGWRDVAYRFICKSEIDHLGNKIEKMYDSFKSSDGKPFSLENTRILMLLCGM